MSMSHLQGRSVRSKLLATLAAGVVALLSLAGTASAHQLFQYEFEQSFKGADTTGGAFTPGIRGVAINQAAHRIYVLEDASVQGLSPAGRAEASRPPPTTTSSCTSRQ